MDTGFALSWFTPIVLAFLVAYLVLKSGKPWEVSAEESAVEPRRLPSATKRP